MKCSICYKTIIHNNESCYDTYILSSDSGIYYYDFKILIGDKKYVLRSSKNYSYTVIPSDGDLLFSTNSFIMPNIIDDIFDAKSLFFRLLKLKAFT